MKVSSSLLSFTIAILATVAQAIILSLLENIQSNEIAIASLLSFFLIFIISFILLEFAIFRHVQTLMPHLGRIAGKKKAGDKNPFENILKSILSYDAEKKAEIAAYKKIANFRKDFIADVSHELKTPIFAAQGFVHTLLDGAVKDKTVRDKFLKRAARSLDGLDLLVQDLMTLSQLEIGEIRMHFEYFDISLLITEVYDQFESKAAKKEIHLKFSKKKEINSIVYADPRRINQVLINLISNAINYSDNGSQVEIKIESSKSFITISIIDNGIGIPPKEIDRIFQRFYRVEKSRSRKQGGTGLGLAIVKHIIEQHNSSINVTSKLGKGSEFRFKLPVGKVEPLFQSHPFK